MFISRNDAKIRKIDGSLSIIELFNGVNFAFDIVIGRLAGEHQPVINFVSDRAYFLLSGTAAVTIGTERREASKGDLITIPKNTPHGLSGHCEYVIITAPPFDPRNEENVDGENRHRK